MSATMEGVGQLLGVIGQCFIIILSGYVTGRVGLISPTESKGLTVFLTYFSLPCLIFSSLATINFGNVCWKFVSAILIAKSIQFIAVVMVALFLTRRNFALAGLFAIFTTQSNDYALGFPLVDQLYAKTHPHFKDYIYVLAPIQLLVLNPIGLVLMEINKAREKHRESEALVNNEVATDGSGSSNSNSSTSSNYKCMVVKNVLIGITTNPIIIMTLLGVIWNLVHGPEVPETLDNIVKVFAAGFSATALFILGLQMVGKFTMLRGDLMGLLIPLILCLMKAIVLPLLIYFVIEFILMDETAQSLANFGYLYGTFPAAPTVLMFALYYNLNPDVVATGQLLSTVMSAPIMFICANMIRLQEEDPSLSYQTEQDMMTTVMYLSVGCLPLIIWTLIVFLTGQKWRSVTHRMTMILLICQLFNCISGILLFFVPMNVMAPIIPRVVVNGTLGELVAPSSTFPPDIPNHLTQTIVKVHVILTVTASFSARIWGTLLAVTLALLHRRSLCYVIKVQKWLLSLGALGSAILVVSSLVFLPTTQDPIGRMVDPAFQFPDAFILPILGLLIPSLVITFFSVLLTQRAMCRSKIPPVTNPGINEATIEEQTPRFTSVTSSLTAEEARHYPTRRIRASLSRPMDVIPPPETPDIEDTRFPEYCTTKGPCCKNNRTPNDCMSKVREYKRTLGEEAHLLKSLTNETDVLGPYHQVVSHLIFCAMLILSMIVGIVTCIGKMMGQSSMGVFLHLEYLELIFNFGQGIVMFLIFGFDTKGTKILCRGCQKVGRFFGFFKGQDMGVLDPDSIVVVEQFLHHHMTKCRQEVTFRAQIDGNDREIFIGQDLVTWLMHVGLSSDRSHACKYGRILRVSGIIKPLTDKYAPFSDSDTPFYFTPDGIVRAESTADSISSQLTHVPDTPTRRTRTSYGTEGQSID